MNKYVILFLMLSACAPLKNSVTSPIQDKRGRTVGSMEMSVLSSYGGGSRITGVASDGEIFNGEIVSDSVHTERILDSFEDSDLFGTRSSSTSSRAKYSSSASTKYSSNAHAVLIGSKGHSMKCDLSLTSPGLGMAVGGIGECRISDGRVVPVTMSRISRF